MPGSLLNADTGFPKFTGQESQEEKIERILSYLYMLQEQLRYTLANLGKENFNESGAAELGELITQPVYARIADAEGNITALNVTAEEIKTTVATLGEGYSEVIQNAAGLESRVSDAEGKATTAKQTAERVETTVSTLDGNFAVVQQTVNGLGVTTNNNVSGLSGQALFFYDNQPMYRNTNNEIGYDSERGNIIGQVSLDTNGQGTVEEAQDRLFVGSGSGYQVKNGGRNAVNFALKLRAAGEMSLESKTGGIYLKPKQDENGEVTIILHNGNYHFKPDGIYFGSTKIVGV